MELRLAITAPDERVREVAVDAQPDQTTGEAAAAIARHMGLGDQPGGWHLCRQVAIPADQSLRDARVRSGEILRLATSGPGSAAAAGRGGLRIVVLGGPLSGQDFPLVEGEQTIGRSPKATIRLADPSVSRLHARVVVTKSTVTLTDLGSHNGTLVGGAAITGDATINEADLVEVGGSILGLRSVPPTAPQSLNLDSEGRVLFNRPPRIASSAAPVVLDAKVPAVPSKPGGLPLATALVPLVLGGAMFALTHQIATLAFALLSPVMAGVTLLQNRVGGGRRARHDRRAFEQRLAGLITQGRAAVQAEAAARRTQFPGPSELLRYALSLDARLWERRPANADFLQLRVGWGELPSKVEVKVGSGVPALEAQATESLTPFRTLINVPITVSLAKSGSVGLAGPTDRVDALARWLVTQAAALHSPGEVAIVAGIGDGEQDAWHSLGWLPHARSDGAGVGPGSSISVGPKAAGALLGGLVSLVDARTEAAHGRANPGKNLPAVLALFTETADVDPVDVARLLANGPAVGVYTVWAGGSVSELPGELADVVELDASGVAARLTRASSGEVSVVVTTDGISTPVALDIARGLAPIRDISARTALGVIPTAVDLLRCLDLVEDRDARVKSSWETPDDGKLLATIGIGGAGPMSISLAGDGPHGLVGGTTTSGKSQLLKTLVASLAARHPPTRISFLLVDYKGGTAFRECVALPHTVGMVTDLDGSLVQRVLVSLRAELNRRLRLLDEVGADDVTQLKAKRPDLVPPSLLIIVDEFRALAKDLPEFVEGMVDIAARGRAIGIHMILATQQPAGIIKDNIRVNTNLRIALRFVDEPDSRDVIDSAVAARKGLPPGRAFVRIGAADPVEFQSAYPDAHSVVQAVGPPVVCDLGFGGIPAKPSQSVRVAPGPTDLQLLVDSIVRVDREMELPRPPRPWLPDLPEKVPLEQLQQVVDASTLTEAWVPLGLVDRPSLQLQHPELYIPSEHGSLLLFGSGGSGRTTSLRTIVTGLAQTSDPADLNIYVLDFGAYGLRPLERLPHVGAVIGSDDPDRLLRLLRMLAATMQNRRVAFGQAGAADLAAYRRGGGEAPQILVVVDTLSALNSALDGAEFAPALEAFGQLMVDGRPLGLQVVATADRRSGVPSKIASAVSRRLVLHMSDESEYAYLGIERSKYRGAKMPSGRSFIEDGVMMQCAIVGSDPDPARQAEAIHAVALELGKSHADRRAPEIRLLPKRVEAADLPAPGKRQAIIGLRDADLAPAAVDLESGNLVVLGPVRSGRSTSLAAIARSLSLGPDEPELYLLAPRGQSPLLRMKIWTRSWRGTEECGQAADEVQDLAQSAAAVLFVDDGEELTDPRVSAALEGYIKRGRDTGARLVAAAETHAARASFGGWLKTLLRDRQGVLLDPDPVADGPVFNTRLPRRFGQWPPGRAYLVTRAGVDTIQVATGAEI